MFRPIYTDEAEIAHYPEDVQALMRDIQQNLDKRYRYYVESYARSEVTESGAVIHYDKTGAIMGSGPVCELFSLSYASWLVLPRLALQEMPLDWQARFVAVMEEGYARGLAGPDNVSVVRKKDGKFVNNDHWNNYRRGTVRHARGRDAVLGIEAWPENV